MSTSINTDSPILGRGARSRSTSQGPARSHPIGTLAAMSPNSVPDQTGQHADAPESSQNATGRESPTQNNINEANRLPTSQAQVVSLSHTDLVSQQPCTPQHGTFVAPQTCAMPTPPGTAPIVLPSAYYLSNAGPLTAQSYVNVVAPGMPTSTGHLIPQTQQMVNENGNSAIQIPSSTQANITNTNASVGTPATSEHALATGQTTSVVHIPRNNGTEARPDNGQTVPNHNPAPIQYQRFPIGSQ